MHYMTRQLQDKVNVMGLDVIQHGRHVGKSSIFLPKITRHLICALNTQLRFASNSQFFMKKGVNDFGYKECVRNR